MKIMRNLIPGLFSAVLLVVLVLGLALIIEGRSTLLPADQPASEDGATPLLATPSQAAYPPPPEPTFDPASVVPYPPPTFDSTFAEATEAAEETLYAPPPTPTLEPYPTFPPTPAGTPVPLAVFPISPLLQVDGPAAYRLIIQGENLLRMIDGASKSESILLDVGARLPLFLVNRRIGVRKWGEASPDGSRLALVLSDSAISSENGGNPRFSIYVFDPQSGDLQALVEDGIDPVWSPDGKWIAYRSTQNDGLWVIDVATRQTRQIFSMEASDGLVPNGIAWSPDGQRLAFVRGWPSFESGELWIVDVESQQATQLAVMDMMAQAPSWSPDGQTIAFLAQPGERLFPEDIETIWLADTNSLALQQLTFYITSPIGNRPVWSPDGYWIAFEGVSKLEENAPYHLWMISRDGKDIIRLTNDSIAEAVAPQWVPGGTQIIFRRPGTAILQIDLLSGAVEQIATDEAENSGEMTVILP